MDQTLEPTPRTKLLIVDDEPAICRLILAAAQECGFAAVAVPDGEAFKDAYRAGPPEVIVMDLGLPGSDGIELLRFLAGRKCLARILVISGHGERVLDAARRLGTIRGLNMAGIISKPIRLAELRAQLATARAAA